MKLHHRGHQLLSRFPDVENKASSFISRTEEVIFLDRVDIHSFRADPVKHLVLLDHLSAGDPGVHHPYYPRLSLADKECVWSHLAVISSVPLTLFFSIYQQVFLLLHICASNCSIVGGRDQAGWVELVPCEAVYRATVRCPHLNSVVDSLCVVDIP